MTTRTAVDLVTVSPARPPAITRLAVGRLFPAPAVSRMKVAQLSSTALGLWVA